MNSSEQDIIIEQKQEITSKFQYTIEDSIELKYPPNFLEIYKNCTISIILNNEDKVCLLIEHSSTEIKLILFDKTIKVIKVGKDSIEVFFKDLGKLTIHTNNMASNNKTDLVKLFESVKLDVVDRSTTPKRQDALINLNISNIYPTAITTVTSGPIPAEIKYINKGLYKIPATTSTTSSSSIITSTTSTTTTKTSTVNNNSNNKIKSQQQQKLQLQQLNNNNTYQFQKLEPSSNKQFEKLNTTTSWTHTMGKILSSSNSTFPKITTTTRKYKYTDDDDDIDYDDNDQDINFNSKDEKKRKTSWKNENEEKRYKSERSNSSRSTNITPLPIINQSRSGLSNLGNTCYMNVILQSMFGLSELFKDIKHEKFKPYIPRDGLYSSLIKLYDKIQSTKKGANIETGVDPYTFKLKINKFCPYFKGYLQHDAHEFFVSLLDILEEELKKNLIQMIKEEQIQFKDKKFTLVLDKEQQLLQQKQQHDDRIKEEEDDIIFEEDLELSDIETDENDKEPGSTFNAVNTTSPTLSKKSTTTTTTTTTNTTVNSNGKEKQDEKEKKIVEELVSQLCPITKHFKSTVTNTFKCCNCHQVSTSNELFTDLSLDLPKSTDPEKRPTLSTLLEKYFEEETIERKCTNCPHTKSILTKHISKNSNILTLHLKRFSMNSNSLLKNNVFVYNSDSIDIGKYMKPKKIIIKDNNSNSSNGSNGSSIVNGNGNGNGNGYNTDHIDNQDDDDTGIAASASTETTTATAIETNQKQQQQQQQEKEKEKKKDIDKPVLYSINAIVKHSGTLDSGHYVCYGLDDKDKSNWKLYDDSLVQSAPQSEAICSNGYILFYTLKK